MQRLSNYKKEGRYPEEYPPTHLKIESEDTIEVKAKLLPDFYSRNYTTDVLGDGISDISIESRMGTDLSVVRAARVSYQKDQGHEWQEKDAKLIKFMADHGHGTPFEHTAITFHVACPLFVVRQWHRHRIGWSYNEVSRRYTSEDIEFYFPTAFGWRMQDSKNKQASVQELWTIDIEKALDLSNLAIRWTYGLKDFYDLLLDHGIGREQARMFLPQNLYTRFYATCNLRSAAHFINLRADEHAQQEIRCYAESMREQLRELFPVSIAALCDPPPPEPEGGYWTKLWNTVRGKV